MEKRCVALENIEGETLKGNNSGIKYTKPTLFGQKQQNTNECIFCNKVGYKIVKCYKFSALSLGERRQAVQRNKLCYVCLGNMHGFSQCPEKGCKTCNKKHHVLLHDDSYKNSLKQGPEHSNDNTTNNGSHGTNPKVLLGISEGAPDQVKQNENSQISAEIIKSHEYYGISHGTDMGVGFQNINQSAVACSNSQILLATAKVNIITRDGNRVESRAFLDSGSQTSFISKSLFQKLKNVDFYPEMFKIGGIGNKITQVNKMVKLVIESPINGYKTNIKCAILEQITCKLPHVLVDTSKIEIPSNILLADPQYFKPAEIDMLISAEIYFDVILPEIVKIGKGLPVLQKSKLGWLVGGSRSVPMSFEIRRNNLIAIKGYNQDCNNEIVESCSVNVNLFCHNTPVDINELIPRFWQMEEIIMEKFLSPDEKLFLESTRRWKVPSRSSHA